MKAITLSKKRLTNWWLTDVKSCFIEGHNHNLLSNQSINKGLKMALYHYPVKIQEWYLSMFNSYVKMESKEGKEMECKMKNPLDKMQVKGDKPAPCLPYVDLF